VAQVEAAVFSLSPWMADYDVNGHTAIRDGNRSDRFVPHGAFACAGDDRWVAIACWDDEAFGRLAGVMGLDGATAERWATVGARRTAVDEIEEQVASWTRPQDATEVAETLQAVGIEAVPVADLGDASVDPQLIHRGHFVSLTHPCMGRCGYERNGFRLSDAPAGYDRTSPTLGEHNEMVLGDILGLDRAERTRLLDEGVLE